MIDLECRRNVQDKIDCNKNNWDEINKVNKYLLNR